MPSNGVEQVSVELIKGTFFLLTACAALECNRGCVKSYSIVQGKHCICSDDHGWLALNAVAGRNLSDMCKHSVTLMTHRNVTSIAFEVWKIYVLKYK